MINKTLAAQFQLLASLMELYGENAFKIKAYSGAYLALRKLDKPILDMSSAEIDAIPGIGSSVVARIREFREAGRIAQLEDLKRRTPEGILQLLSIKGLGPKKVKTIWEALKIESPAELLYACEENRLVALPGFGQKTQEELRGKVAYFLESADRHLYGQVEAELSQVRAQLEEAWPGHTCIWAGDFAVRKPVLDELLLLVAPPVPAEKVTVVPGLSIESGEGGKFKVVFRERFQITIRMTESGQLPTTWAEATLQPGLAAAVRPAVHSPASLPAAILRGTRWETLPVEWYDRPGVEILEPADWEGLLKEEDLRGILHNHSTWSDGAHSLEEMALHVRDAGYEYFAICDHSRSAFYANGLDADRVLAQAAEIDRLNERLAPFRIYKGIESDILGDGSLDYPDDVLSSFDLIVASVHSNLRMEEGKATERLIRAVENPYTRILGHPTGRLLLARPGYPIDHRRVIDACAANGVVIELNANPLRLDIDLAWIPYCMEKGVLVSINPDAHSRGQVAYTRYGVMAARRGGLTKAGCLNAKGLAAFEDWRVSR